MKVLEIKLPQVFLPGEMIIVIQQRGLIPDRKLEKGTFESYPNIKLVSVLK